MRVSSNRSDVFIVVLVYSFSSVFTLPQSRVTDLSSLISANDCTFYSTLNTIYECGPKSHLMTYSTKYCQRLVNARDTFENTKYQDDARLCLQQSLYNKIRQTEAGTITCDSFKHMDLDSLGSCYAMGYKTFSKAKRLKSVIRTQGKTNCFMQIIHRLVVFSSQYRRCSWRKWFDFFLFEILKGF